MTKSVYTLFCGCFLLYIREGGFFVYNHRKNYEEAVKMNENE